MDSELRQGVQDPSKRRFLKAVASVAATSVLGAAGVKEAEAKEQERIPRVTRVSRDMLSDYGIEVRRFGDRGLLRSSEEAEGRTSSTVSELIDRDKERAGFLLQIPVDNLEGANSLRVSFNEPSAPVASSVFDTEALGRLLEDDGLSGPSAIEIYCLDADFARQLSQTKGGESVSEALLTNAVVTGCPLSQIDRVTAAVMRRQFTRNEDGVMVTKEESVYFSAARFQGSEEIDDYSTTSPAAG